MRIGVLANPSSWHFLDLQRAAGDRHEIVSISFDDLSTEFSLDSANFRDTSTDLLSLDRLIVRTMPKGSLQQIIFRMDLLARLESAGVKILNSPKTIEIAVDKYLSLSLLAEADVAVPSTGVAESLSAAMDCFDRLGGDVVYKPIFGSMGRGIVRVTDREIASDFFESQINEGQVIYLQKFINHSDWDLRILIVGDKAFSIKRQRAGHWLTNISQGAIGSPYSPNASELALARAAAKATGCVIAGVDIFYERHTEKPMVCDVNAAPGWQGTANTLGADIGQAILDVVSATQP